jgi:hypothetical protein
MQGLGADWSQGVDPKAAFHELPVLCSISNVSFICQMEITLSTVRVMSVSQQSS